MILKARHCEQVAERAGMISESISMDPDTALRMAFKEVFGVIPTRQELDQIKDFEKRIVEICQNSLPNRK